MNVSNSGYYYILASSKLNDPTPVSATNVLDFVSSSSKSVNSINVIPVDTPSTYISGQKGTYIFSLAYPDGVILDTSEIEKLLPDLNVTLQNSVPVQTTLATYNNELVVNFTFTGYGFYTLTIYGQYVSGLITYSISHSQQITVTPITKTSVGMSLTFGINSLNTNQSYVIPLYLYYGNGTRMDLSDTELAFAYSTLYILDGNTVIHTYAPSNFSAGVIDFAIAPLKTGQYTFFANVAKFSISGVKVHASLSKVINVSPAVASPLTAFENFWNELGSSLSQNLLVTFLVTLTILAGAYFIKIFWTHIRGDKKTATQINDTILADAIKHLEQPYSQMSDTLKAFTGLEYSEQSKFLTASKEVLRLEKVTIGGKQTDLEKVRDYIMKVKRHPDGASIFSRIASKAKKDLEARGGKK